MVQTSVQFTPVQVLQAARRAEAEGKMDYALQFYRHLVEQHGTTPEAQEAREGLFRIAEWRWGEARVARGRDATGGGAQNAQNTQSAPGSQTPPAAPAGNPSGQRVYNVANNTPPSDYYADQPQVAAAPGKLPQVIALGHGEDEQAFRPRFRVAKFLAHALSAIGWLTLLAGVGAAVGGLAGLVGELSAVGLLGVPFGALLALPALVLGIVLVVAGQLAAAVFESTNANLELVAIERGRNSF
ncbi:MAG: hypothetical protein H7Y62_00330 [Hyphomicrobium sp.]|nr:hypothetical protein [Hyphomicrobium sp.]